MMKWMQERNLLTLHSGRFYIFFIRAEDKWRCCYRGHDETPKIIRNGTLKECIEACEKKQKEIESQKQKKEVTTGTVADSVVVLESRVLELIEGVDGLHARMDCREKECNELERSFARLEAKLERHCLVPKD